VLGTIINTGAVVAGSVVGASLGSRLPEKIRETVLSGLGLVTSLIGLQMALESKNILIVLGAVLIGAIIGELLRLEEGLNWIGATLQGVLARGSESTFGEGLVTASLVFCVGPMSILGSISDGLSGDYKLLAVKAALDGFAAIAFAASLGWGVLFSALTVLIYQGGITLFAAVLEKALTQPMITEMTATGGLIIVGIGLKLLNLKEMRLANFLPALVTAPLLVALVPIVKALFY
jgi:uncharacterized membrane protein YqgA involved in biofilm formation